MKLLSLFSGIGAFEKALDYLNVNYELVNYCEIDKYASKSYSLIHNVSEEKNLGDITKVDTSKLPNDIDIITYGFPCQDISMAGKQKGFVDENGEVTRSGLFFEAWRLIRDTQPKIAIAENVKALVSKKFTNEFNIVLESLEEIGYNNYYKILNSKDYGVPQNRERVFIVSIRKDIDPFDMFNPFPFPEPYELELRLRDMLEDEVDEKYYLSDKMIEYISCQGTKNFKNPNCKINLDIARPLTTDQNKRAGTTNYLCEELPDNYDLKDVKRLGGVFDRDGKTHQAGSVYDKDGVAPTLTTMEGGYRQPCIVEMGKIYPNRNSSVTNSVISSDGISPTVLSSSFGQPKVVEVPLKRGYSVEVTEESQDTTEIDVIGNYSKSDYKATQIVGKNGVSPTIRENHGQVTAITEKSKINIGGNVECVADGNKITCNGVEIKEGKCYGKYAFQQMFNDKPLEELSPTIKASKVDACVLVKDKNNNVFPLHKDTKQLRETIEQNEFEEGQPLNLDLYNRATYEHSQTLTDPTHNSQRLFDGLRIRKLTPKECFRLMGFEDDVIDTLTGNGISNTQLYKQAGNSIVVDVLEELFVQLFKYIPSLLRGCDAA